MPGTKHQPPVPNHYHANVAFEGGGLANRDFDHARRHREPGYDEGMFNAMHEGQRAYRLDHGLPVNFGDEKDRRDRGERRQRREKR